MPKCGSKTYTMEIQLVSLDYRARQNKISQHENCCISEMPEYY